jgi:hypothetical protein
MQRIAFILFLTLGPVSGASNIRDSVCAFDGIENNLAALNDFATELFERMNAKGADPIALATCVSSIFRPIETIRQPWSTGAVESTKASALGKIGGTLVCFKDFSMKA